MKTCIIIPWFNYWKTSNDEEFSLVRSSLEKQGYNAYIFDYEERPNYLNDLLERLDEYIKKNKNSEIILIGFCLGSYISLKYIEKYKNNKIKKAVLCIPPIKGSKFFRVCYGLWPNFRHRTGKLVYDLSYDNLEDIAIPKNINVGIIRGTKRIGRRFFHCLLTQIFLLGKKNDGLIELSETEFKDHEKITLPINHHESPKNYLVIKNIIRFIENSSFK